MATVPNSQELEDRLSIAYCLVGLAGILAILGKLQRAARLSGTADVLWETIGAQIQAGDRPDYENNLANTRDQLAPRTFEATWLEGRAMSLEQAVASHPRTQ